VAPAGARLRGARHAAPGPRPPRGAELPPVSRNRAGANLRGGIPRSGSHADPYRHLRLRPAKGHLRGGAGAGVSLCNCNCTQCQRRTGSAYSVHAYFDRGRVRIEGESRRFRRSSDAGRWVEFGFCPGCGSTVYWEMEL
jgi:Glutathione-dependent formaldehyde-activating enzyme